VLLDGHLRLDLDNPDDPRNDHLIFSKGHASPLHYSADGDRHGVPIADLSHRAAASPNR
jgi:transketolase